jgi:uncharacterized membrane-anchored protein
MPAPEITRHVLKSDGSWVDLRDVSLVRAGERKAAMAHIYAAARQAPADGETPSMDSLIAMIGASTEFAEFVAATLIVRWYVPDLHEEAGGPQTIDRRNLAGTVAAINDLRGDDYDRLLELAIPAIEALSPRSITPDDVDNPASPSEPASD